MISVIIPVYQREKLVGRVIESILHQTYEEFEIILVDDGSTDNTGKICEEYKKRDSRIAVIHQQNCGSLSARKNGIKIAKGDYICFVDSDDYLDYDFLEILYTASVKSDADITVSTHDLIYENGERDSVFYKEQDHIMSSENALLEMLKRKIFGWELVGKLYKRKIIDRYCFKEGLSYAEDLVSNWEIFHLANKIMYIPYTGYHYYRHEDNITNNIQVRRMEYVKAIKVLFDSRFDRNKSWEALLNVLEKMLFDTIIGWSILKAQPDETYFELVRLFNDVEEEKKLNQYKTKIAADDITSDLSQTRERYREECIGLLDRLKLYIGDEKLIYVFGNGVWSRRLATFLQYWNIDIAGYVVSTSNMKKEISAKQLLVNEISTNKKLIVCVSAKIESEVKEIINNRGIKAFFFSEKERELLTYANQLIN